MVGEGGGDRGTLKVTGEESSLEIHFHTVTLILKND